MATNSIGGQFSLGLVGGGNGWSEADEAGGAAIWEAHKQYTLEFYHFLTTDPALPEGVRQRYARLGLCKDEFPEYDHFSPALYVREGMVPKDQEAARLEDRPGGRDASVGDDHLAHGETQRTLYGRRPATAGT